MQEIIIHKKHLFFAIFYLKSLKQRVLKLSNVTEYYFILHFLWSNNAIKLRLYQLERSGFSSKIHNVKFAERFLSGCVSIYWSNSPGEDNWCHNRYFQLITRGKKTTTKNSHALICYEVFERSSKVQIAINKYCNSYVVANKKLFLPSMLS